MRVVKVLYSEDGVPLRATVKHAGRAYHVRPKKDYEKFQKFVDERFQQPVTYLQDRSYHHPSYAKH